MKNLTLTLMLFFGLTLFAQQSGEVVFYSNANDQFFVVLNGIQQNTSPQTNVKIQGLIEPWYGCKIVSNDNIFTIEKNIMVKKDTLITYQIIEKKGNYKIRYFSETPLKSVPVEATQEIVAYHSTPSDTPVIQTQTGQTTVTTTTTVVQTGNSADVITTDGSSNDGVNETVGVNMTVDENGMSVNMTVTDTGTEMETIQGGNATITYSETTTTTTTTNSGNGTGQSNVNTEEITTSAPMTNCLVDGSDMKIIVKMVNEESFADDKMRVAKQYAKKKCLTVNQVKEIAVLFSFSADQVEFVKFAYSSCINKDDYYQVMDVFTFSEDKEAIGEFLDKQ